MPEKPLKFALTSTICLPDRQKVYYYLKTCFRACAISKIQELLPQYQKVCDSLKATRWKTSRYIITKKDFQIIGCTIAGLAKYRGLIASIKPQVMLVEEAAKARESAIAAALYPSLERLILIGDHHQQPHSVDVCGLNQDPFNLHISMFERLVKLGVPHHTLQMAIRSSKYPRRHLCQEDYHAKDQTDDCQQQCSGGSFSGHTCIRMRDQACQCLQKCYGARSQQQGGSRKAQKGSKKISRGVRKAPVGFNKRSRLTKNVQLDAFPAKPRAIKSTADYSADELLHYGYRRLVTGWKGEEEKKKKGEAASPGAAVSQLLAQNWAPDICKKEILLGNKEEELLIDFSSD
jgi:hypothetical protein